MARAQTKADFTSQIRDVLRAQQMPGTEAISTHSMNGYARSDSTTFVSEDKVTRGWHTVRDRYRKKYSNRAKMGGLTVSALEITSLGNDSAFASGTWRLKRAQDQPRGRFTLIFRRTNKGWRIVHDHTSAAK